MTLVTRSLELIFEAYIAEKRELGPRELKNKYPKAVKAAYNAYPGRNLSQIIKIIRKAYVPRWDEINPKPTEIVASISILDKMRMAAEKVNNE